LPLSPLQLLRSGERVALTRSEGPGEGLRQVRNSFKSRRLSLDARDIGQGLRPRRAWKHETGKCREFAFAAPGRRRGTPPHQPARCQRSTRCVLLDRADQTTLAGSLDTYLWDAVL